MNGTQGESSRGNNCRSNSGGLDIRIRDAVRFNNGGFAVRTGHRSGLGPGPHHLRFRRLDEGVEIVADDFAATGTMGGVNGTDNLATLGVLQPVWKGDDITAGAEGGFDYFNYSGGTSKGSGFVGGRGTWEAPSSKIKVNLMYRYHWAVPGGLWQAGIGASGPLTSKLEWQLDYYRFKANSNAAVIGVRWRMPEKEAK